MKRIKRTLITISAVAVAVLGIGIFAPKAAHAVQEVMVFVANTRANPVPNQDVDEPARHPYVATCSADVKGNISFCKPSPAPPLNSRVVIQSVVMGLNTFGTGTPQYGVVSAYSATVPAAVTYVPFTVPPATSAFWPAHLSTNIYEDYNAPGLTCSIGVVNFNVDTIIDCTVSGYYVTLP
jgi:hypothetical protein